MCVKLLPVDLNPDFYFPHLTSIYTYGVTTTLKMRDLDNVITMLSLLWLIYYV